MSGACPELGFIVRIEHDDAPALLVALRALLAEHDLVAQPNGPNSVRIGRAGSQAVNADRELVRAWAQARGLGNAVIVSDLVDL